MNAQFVDTYYLIALLNSKDSGHEFALRHHHSSVRQLVTTSWVLVEFADALASAKSRSNAAGFLQEFVKESFVEVIPPSWSQFERAIQIYGKRSDKDWSLTDCISFLVMEERSLTEALTADRHFEQAGFVALMRDKSE